MQSNFLWGEKLNTLVAPGGFVGLSDNSIKPLFAAYRLDINVDKAATHEIFVHAEERYELFLNGVMIGQGSERGDLIHRFCESYNVALCPGYNRLLLRVWSLGQLAPFAQMTGGNWLAIFSADSITSELLGTGLASWRVKRLSGYDCMVDHPTDNMTGPSFRLDGREIDWDWMADDSAGWEPAMPVSIDSAIALYRATLPPQTALAGGNGVVRHVDDVVTTRENPVLSDNCKNDEFSAWTGFLSGSPVTVPMHTVRRVIIDLNEYRCFYPTLKVFGGRDATIRFSWLEALYTKPTWHCSKGNRDEIESKYFYAPGDIFIADGGNNREFSPLWWRSGRYLELHITTAAAPLTMMSLTLRDTGYPLQEDADFQCSDTELNRIRPLLVHSLQMCSHETYMDCPYFEQLMYVGDTRIEVLVNYVMTRDHRLARKALGLFFDSIAASNSGLTYSRYPSTRTQIISPFSLWWIAMAYDYAQWHDEPELISAMLPGMRQILTTFAATAQDDSVLVTGPLGWNFYDWVGDSWPYGVPPTQKDWTWGHLPPDTYCGQPPTPDAMPNAIMNHHYAMVLSMAAKLELYVGDSEQSVCCQALAVAVTNELLQKFWHDERKLFADDLGGRHYSEHAQILALLSGLLPQEKVSQLVHSLLNAPDLSRTTIYFSHYLLDVIGRFSDYSEFNRHLSLWFGLAAQGFRTTPESPEPSRSDCHAWGAHPYYHYFATIAGIRPSMPGGNNFVIRPIAGLPDQCSGSLPLRQGDLKFVFRRNAAILSTEITIPAGVSATLEWNNQRVKLNPGINHVEL